MQSFFPAFTARAPWWGGHLQTFAGMLPRRHDLDRYPGERLTVVVPDGTGDRLVATLHRPAKRAGQRRCLILLVHGVSGSQNSSYILASAAFFLNLGYSVLRCNLRGAGPSRRLCKRQYHAGTTEDLDHIIAGLPPTLREDGIVAVGYSLGANIVLKFLGERGQAAPVQAAVLVSSPLDLAVTTRRLMQWDNALFHRPMLSLLKAESLRPASDLTARERRAISDARTIQDFDEHFTAPRNGFSGAFEYYKRTSCRHFLNLVSVPSLLIYALDDPLVPYADYLKYEWHRNQNLVPLMSRFGGHIGFQGLDRDASWHDACAARFVEMLFSHTVWH
jgi:uncharacterized protein